MQPQPGEFHTMVVRLQSSVMAEVFSGFLPHRPSAGIKPYFMPRWQRPNYQHLKLRTRKSTLSLVSSADICCLQPEVICLVSRSKEASRQNTFKVKITWLVREEWSGWRRSFDSRLQIKMRQCWSFCKDLGNMEIVPPNIETWGFIFNLKNYMADFLVYFKCIFGVF